MRVPGGFYRAQCELARFEWIPGLEGDTWSGASAVNADGNVIVGGGESHRAYRWERGVTRDIGQLPGYDTFTQHTGLSADGSIVVGAGTGANATRGFRWEAGVLKALPPLLGETSSTAMAISATERPSWG